MTFQDLPAGAAVFLDANTLVYHFEPHPVLGLPCTDLIERIENQDLRGFTSAHVVTETAHRLMTLEACAMFGWPYPGIAQRLRGHPAQVQSLTRFRQAIQELPRYAIHIVPIAAHLPDAAAQISQQTGLLSSDALVVAVMQEHGLTNLASHDADFDRVPGLTRYAPA
ncbi:MAG: type II toxin-antitoxin system VapC family toxin [Pirellulales bacterium]|nr:type II toxin-antitoxin system VapC family toxin [Pirellulales bacterium]